MLGYSGGDSSTLIYFGVVGLWAFGRTLDAQAVRTLELATIAGLVLNAVYGTFQVAFDVVGGAFNAHPGRASGFLANPAYYGAVMSGGVAWAGVRALSTGTRRHVVLVAVMAFGFGLSGGRIAIGILVVLGAIALTVLRNRRAAAVVAVGATGFGLALLMTQLTSRSSSVSRLSEQGGSGRLGMWQYGLEAWGERPVLGWGLGRSGVAIQSRISTEFAIANGRDDTVLDLHNIIVTLLVATGVVGVALALGFAVHAVRGVNRPAALAFAAAVAANWMLQPASIHSLPIAMLLLGSAAASRAPHAPDGDRGPAAPGTALRSTVVPQRVALVVGFTLAAALLMSSWAVRAASLAGDPEAMESRAWIYRGDPVVSDLIAVDFLKFRG